MPKGRRLPRRGPVWIAFGEPIDVASARFAGDDRAAADEVRSRTLALLADLARQSGLPVPSNASARDAAPGTTVPT
jgi:hypothetical protein